MRLLSLTALALVLAGCGNDAEEQNTTNSVDYSKLQTTSQTEAALTLASTDELSRHIKNGMRLQLKDGVTYLKSGGLESGDQVSAPNAPNPNSDSEQVVSDGGSAGFSETNVHVYGVDEADYAKYDGKHWFVATTPNYQDFFIDTMKPGFQIVATDPLSPNAEVISRVELDDNEDQWGNVNAMYLVQDNDTTTHIATIRNQWGNVRPYLPGAPIRIFDGGGIASPELAVDTELAQTSETAALRIALPTDIDQLFPNPQNSRVLIQLTDVQTPSSPKQDWELTLDGSLIDSRKVGNMLYLLTRFDPWVDGLYFDNNDLGIREKNETELASISSQQLLPNYQIGDVEQPLSSSCYLQKDIGEYSGYTSLVSITAIDLSTQKLVASQCINSSLEAMSMTTTSLYLTGTTYGQDVGSRKTVIHKFKLTENGPEYVATGSASGSLGWNSDINFRMHEQDDTFRIVTSDWTENGPEHMLTILKEQGQSLNTLSTLPNSQHPEPIGKPREEIYSVRFEKNRAYIVTFQRTDPLYTIDLSDPENPVIAGELKIPGFATYIHPVGDDFLFTLGRDADEKGRALGMKAELIDVSEAEPRVMNTLYFGGQSTNSEALNDLKALSFKRDEDRLRITMPISMFSEQNAWQYAGLQLMEITNLASASQQDPIAERIIAAPTTQLINAGTIISETASDSQNYYSSYGVNRSIIHDNAVFYAHNNAFWVANWDEPKSAIGPITEAPVACIAIAPPPALIVNLTLESDASRNPCEANVTAYNNNSGTEITLEASPQGEDTSTCSFSGYGPAGEYTVISELDGYQHQKTWAVVYRNECHVLTEQLTIELKPADAIICTTEARPSLSVYVDIESSGNGISACDASVTAIHDGVHYQLYGQAEYFLTSATTPNSGAGEAKSSDGITLRDDEKLLIIADPIPVEPPTTRCVFSGPYEVSGLMSLEVSLDGYEASPIEDIYVERDECHVLTQSTKVWLGLQAE